MLIKDAAEQLNLFGQDICPGKMSLEHSAPGWSTARTSVSFSKKSAALQHTDYLFLDLRAGAGNLLGQYWEMNSPSLGEWSALNTGLSHSGARESSLSRILQAIVQAKYYLSKTACLGILRRAAKRGKLLPVILEKALKMQAGIGESDPQPMEFKAYHINQRDEGIDLDGVSGALIATQNMQMQTFVTGEPQAYAANQRDELRDLHDISAAVCAHPGLKQQTFVAQPSNCLNSWDAQQARIFTEDSLAPAVCGADGGGGRNPAGLLLEKEGGGHGYVAAFCAGAGAKAQGIGYEEETAPTLKSAQSGNSMPSVLCLCDQGGQRMDVVENVCGTLRARMDGRLPMVMGSQQGGAEICEDLCPTIAAAAGSSGNNQPILLFGNHGIDTRYTGPHEIAPTVTSRYGTGGLNTPLTLNPQEPETYAIAGNIIGRKDKNGGNGLGYQRGLSYTITATDNHCVCEPAPYQDVVGALCRGDEKGIGNQYVEQGNRAGITSRTIPGPPIRSAGFSYSQQSTGREIFDTQAKKQIKA